MNRKIPAFTILEVTITMLISAVVIATTYTAAHIISVTYFEYHKKQDKVATFRQLDALLKKDFMRVGIAIKTSDGMVVKLPEGEIKYSFIEGMVLREQLALQTDTFKVGAKDVVFLYEQVPVTTGGFVDKLAFKLDLEGAELPLHYKKVYSAQDLFK
jgi:hypothetical protein